MKSFEELKNALFTEFTRYIERIRHETTLCKGSTYKTMGLSFARTFGIKSGDKGLKYAEAFLAKLKKFKNMGTLLYECNRAHWGHHSENIIMSEIAIAIGLQALLNDNKHMAFECMHDIITDQLSKMAMAETLEAFDNETAEKLADTIRAKYRIKLDRCMAGAGF